MKTAAFAKTYGGRTVLDMPEQEFGAGRVCAVLGANGSGKSTLARVLAGSVSADGGVKPLGDAGVSVGYMPQKSFAFRMTVLKNLLLAGNDRARAEELLEELGLGQLAGARAKTLSGGETQKLALGRVLMRDCGLLILDEPTSSMDVESALEAEKLIDDYRRRTGSAVLLVTHSPPQAARLADDVLFLYKGKLAERGACAGHLTAPRSPELKRYLDFCQTDA